MDPLTNLGATLATIRRLRGLSVKEAATAAALPLAELRQAEAGWVSQRSLEQLALLFGLDPELLAAGIAVPASEQMSKATVFLLHGAYQDFNASDWGVLERAMQSARVYSTKSETGRKGLVQRLGMLPTPPAGPKPRDAAQQGYKLARLVRARLQLEGAPIDDIRALLEERLGIAVLVEALSTIDLRAASVLDVDRVSAAAVLSAADEARHRNPLLTRVYLAHELCHLLFDPSAPDRVQIALDDHPQGSSRSSLLESRAKAFAAEFLLPEQGLVKLLGAHSSPQRNLRAAREMVASAAEAFKTPREITTWHLNNLQFIAEALVGEILQASSAHPPPVSTTLLPSPGHPPLCLRDVLVGPQALQGPGATDDALPAFVLDARKMAEEQVRLLGDEVLKATYDRLEQGAPAEATDFIVDCLDALLLGNEFSRVQAILERLDANRVPPGVLTGVLSLTWHAKQALGDVRTRFFDGAMRALEITWGVSEERRARIAERLR